MSDINYHEAVAKLALDKDVTEHELFCFAYEWYFGGRVTLSDLMKDAIWRGYMLFKNFVADPPYYVRAYIKAAHAALEN